MSKISVVIVTYNSTRTIEDCLKSLEKYSPQSEIVVVDNGSSDSTLEIIKKNDGRVKIVEAGENLGFAKGNNLGVKNATGEYLVFLNPDAFLTKHQDLEYLQKILEENPEFGILGPKLVYADNTPQPRVRNLPTLNRAFEEYILGRRGVYGFYDPKCKTYCEVESVIGACMIIRKDLFERVGGFNEKYFMYYEDLELCKALKDRGYKVGFVPEVTVIHAEGVSGQNQKTKELMKTSAKKYFGTPTYYLLEGIFFYNRLVNKLRKMVGQKPHV